MDRTVGAATLQRIGNGNGRQKRILAGIESLCQPVEQGVIDEGPRRIMDHHMRRFAAGKRPEALIDGLLPRGASECGRDRVDPFKARGCRCIERLVFRVDDNDDRPASGP